MKKPFTFSLLVGLFLSSQNIQAQASIKDSSITITELQMGYALQAPIGLLSERFGWNSNLGFNVNFKLKSQWNFGIDGSFIFGNKINDPTVLSTLRNQDGEIIDNNGEYAKVLVYERGFTVFANAGRLMPVIGPNPNSGFLVKFGVGFMQHKIRIEANRNPVPQLEGDYVKGYDRLVNGIALQQFIGYQYLSNRRLINFFFGLEFYEGFTVNRRSFNYDLLKKEEGTRLDILSGLRVGWILPIYARPPREFYYN